LKFGCDDITAVVTFLEFKKIEEMELVEEKKK